MTSIFNQPGTESVLVSPDKSTMLISFGFSSSPQDEATLDAIKAVRQHITETPPPAGLSAHLTGAAAISADQHDAILAGVGRTAIVTILLVVFILLLIYRSPVAAMTPLLTIGMAYLVSRGALGYLASWGWTVSSFVDTFIIVIIFGVGTDYCLFLLSRFREELGRRGTRDEAIVATVSAIGAVISASAATVIVALLFMATGKFVMLQTMGPAMALCVFITLMAGLTLTPAMVAILGHYLFWPRHDEIQHESGKTWQRIAEIATTRYHLVIPVVVGMLLIPYLVLPSIRQTFDVLAEMPKSTDSVQGFSAMAEGFDAGELLPVTVLLTSNDGNILDNLSKVDQVTTALENAGEVQRVRSLLSPTGDEATANAFHVSTQLKQVSGGLQTLITSLNNPQAATSQQSGSQQSGSPTSISSYLKDLGSVKTVASDPAYTESVTRTQALDASLAKLTQSSLVANQLDATAKQMAALSQTISAGQAATATQPVTSSRLAAPPT